MTGIHRNKVILGILFILLMFLYPAHQVSADGPAPITGKFSPSIGPQANSIEVLNESYQPVYSLTPNTYYLIKLTIGEHEGIGRLKDIDLKMWYDDSGKGSEVDENGDFEHDSTYDGGSGYRRVQFKWDRDSNSNNVRYAYATNWKIDQSGHPSDNQLNDSRVTSHVFYFRVQISRGANEAVDGAVWQIAARVKNKSEQSHYIYYNNGLTNGIPVNYYGEMVVPADTKVEWANGVAGMSFADSVSHQKIPKDMEYFANGLYELRVKASPVWTRTSDGTQVRLSTDAASPGTFALRAFIGPKPNNPLNAVSLLADGSYTKIKDGENYGEENVIIPQAASYNNLYLQANKDLLPGTYTGLIYYSIANR